MTSSDVQYSEDGNYWWDGQQWQPVDQSQSGGQSPSSSSGEQPPESGDGQQGGQDEQPIDWTQFPTLWLIASSSDVNDHYQKIGIDPESLNSSGEGSEQESEANA